MGTCLSKKSPPSSSSTPAPTTVVTQANVDQNKSLRAVAPEETVKKEVFLIKQRKSHERRPEERPNFNLVVASPLSSSSSGDAPNNNKATPVRASSCTKEEVDAILIQCGRLSRSSSGNTEAAGGGCRKYSGSKRSFDFDQENNRNEQVLEDELVVHRRTPTRDGDSSGNRRHRSSSTAREEERKRNGGSTSRRLSRSPGRRSDQTTITLPLSKGPAKMVSVPASTTGAIKRVSVKRATASPRSQSPANANARDNNNSGPTLSRNSSRKAEQSPYRRNPLTEIDDNVPKSEQINKKPLANKVHNTTEEGAAIKKPYNFQSQKPNDGKNQKILNEEEESQKGNENSKLTRTRSSCRRSRDLDFVSNDVADEPIGGNAPTSYASLLLEDIQNFHQKNSNSNTPFSLPPCVTKACSILDAVADLNSSTTSNISDSHVSNTISNSNISRSVSPFSAHSRKISSEVVGKDPLVETEVFVYDDLMEPSVHKYITVRRGAAAEGVELELEQQESSGSNSIVGQQWFSSSWEPNSADSTDHWSSSSNTRDIVVVDKEEPSHKKKVFSEPAARKLRSSGTHLASVSAKKKELDYHQQQVGKPSAATASL